MAGCKIHPGKPKAATHGGAAYCEECKKQIEAAAKTVDKHVSPKECFVVYEGTKTGFVSFTSQSSKNTGCAHWVAHELGIKKGGTCLDGYSIRVKDVVQGRGKVEAADVKVGMIWADDKLSHVGLVSGVKQSKDGEPEINIQHCSSKQGKVATNDWKNYFKGGGTFYKA